MNENIKSQEIVNSYFYNLNQEEKNILIKLHYNLLISLQNQYHISHFTNNDLIECLFILLPYINTDKINDLKNITKLDEIYRNTEKEYNNDTKQYEDYDKSNILNQKPPKYTFSNIEYNIFDEKNNIETEFKKEHLINNYKLLKQTIEKTASRLYPNWGTIFPIKFKNNEKFVKNILEYYNYFFIKDNYFINNDKLTIIDYNNSNIEPINYKHLSLYTIHNSIHYYYSNPNLKYLTDNIINNIIDIFNNNTYKRHINTNEIISILKFIKKDKIYEQKTYKELNELYNNKIKKYINYLIIISLFLLTKTGTLNVFEYKYNDINDMIENKNSPITKEEIKEYDNNIYFLTKKTYKELDDMEDKAYEHNINDIENIGYNEKVKKKNMIKNIKKIKNIKILTPRILTQKEKDDMKLKHLRDIEKYKEYNGFYSLMWMTQLKFYYKFINCRVIYLTGGTGVGKSTQIPKLLLYGLNTFDFKIDGKLINSQPRQKPTESNAKNIAKQMGIMIEDFNANQYIQFQHGDKDLCTLNLNEKFNNLYEENHIFKDNELLFKVCTDRILLNDILKYPIYTTNTYSKNVFDCIMIDETHEHNVNMDIILSIIKQIIMLNNTLRLIIVSATMENDEPYYRRFYKDVIDNQKYPNNCISQFIDKSYLDRRIHISEPGKDTTYKIIEHYNDKFIDNEEERNKKIKEILLKILNYKNTKDILIFKSGAKEIKDCINYLNNYLPSNVYCFPYLSNTNYYNQSIPSFLDKYNEYGPESIHISKNINLLEEQNDNLTDITKGTNNYDHVIFIGTNIIEASITLNRLNYVIDDGQQNIMIYDYNTKIEQLITMNIAETNRKQRKGRVGRNADGEVYYLYPEHYLEKEQLQYKICNENLENIFYDILIDKNSTLLLTNNNSNLIKYLYDHYNNDNIISILNNTFLRKYLYTHNFNYLYLYDPYFKNLIIHPLEKNIIRNILGNVISNTSNIYIDNNELSYPVFKKYTFEDLINKYLSLNLILNKHNLNDNDNFIKTIFSKKLSYILQDSKDDYNIQLSLMLVLGKKLNIYDDILFIVFLLINRSEEKIKNVNNIYDNRSDIYNLYLNFKYNKDDEFNIYSNNFKNFKYDIKYNIINQLSNYILNLKDIQTLSFYNKLSFILLVCFNNNIFKKIPNTYNKGVNLFIPNNILTYNKNVLSNQCINDIVIYINCIKKSKNNIDTTTISLLHSLDKSFFKYISNIIIFNYEKIKTNIKNIVITDNNIDKESYRLTLYYLLSLLRLIKYYNYDIYNNTNDLNINDIDCDDYDEPINYNHILFKTLCEEKKFELFISNYDFMPIITNKYIIYFNFCQNNSGLYLNLHYLNSNSNITINNNYLTKIKKSINKKIKDLTNIDIKNILECYNSNDVNKFIDLNNILSNKKDFDYHNIYYLSCHTYNPEFNYLSTLHIKNGDYKQDLQDNNKYYALIYINKSIQFNFNSSLHNSFSKEEYDNNTDEVKFILNTLKDTFNNCYQSFIS